MSAKINRILPRHRGRVFELFTENITLENDVTVDIDILRHPGAAAMVAMNDNNEVLLIRQYRHAVGGYIWEIPAGTREADEPPLACARRELIEETGYRARTWEKLGELTPVPGYSDERIHVFLAMDLSTAKGSPDEDELLTVHRIPFSKALLMIEQGEIQDAKTVYGLFMVMRTNQAVL